MVVANEVLRFLSSYAILDTSRKKGLARAMKWNDIPWDADADPETKALEFDLQVRENKLGAVRRWGSEQA